MTNKVCFALYCMCTFCLTGRSSALYSVVSADGKLQTSWNWFSSPTLLSLCEFILLVSTTGLSPRNSFLSKHFIFRKRVFSFFLFFFFSHQETVPFDHIWKQWCRRKNDFLHDRPRDLGATFQVFFLCKSVKTSERVPLLFSLLQYWLIHAALWPWWEDSHYWNSGREEACHATLLHLLMAVSLSLNSMERNLMYLYCEKPFWKHTKHHV